jgi:hypothetical protein
MFTKEKYGNIQQIHQFPWMFSAQSQVW